MTEKRWVLVTWECCPNCGDSAEVFTEGDGSTVYDSEWARCNECKLQGQVAIDEDGYVYVNWNEDDTHTCSCGGNCGNESDECLGQRGVQMAAIHPLTQMGIFKGLGPDNPFATLIP